ncbi:hypothetical protein Q3G72_015540 [Acer saccharum]|nr:hypothetical protein Q3G72_015540 [Acer saccharum]
MKSQSNSNSFLNMECLCSDQRKEEGEVSSFCFIQYNKNLKRRELICHQESKVNLKEKLFGMMTLHKSGEVCEIGNPTHVNKYEPRSKRMLEKGPNKILGLMSSGLFEKSEACISLLDSPISKGDEGNDESGGLSRAVAKIGCIHIEEHYIHGSAGLNHQRRTGGTLHGQSLPKSEEGLLIALGEKE